MSAQEVMGEEVLLEMSWEVTKKLRENPTVHWAVRDSVRARLRIIIRNLLKRYKYPLDEQKGAVEIVLRQAEVCQKMWWHEMTGRDERFPCGSGKKYKVCCFGNILELPTQKKR